MMSRTVRYFKLMYIVAGILMSREDVCETVDQIQIAPRVDVFEKLQPARVYRGVERLLAQRWRKGFDLFYLRRLRRRLQPLLDALSIWTIPSYLLDRSTQYISGKLIIDSNCDMIYSR